MSIRPPAKDPWKGLRGVMAGTLILEAIVVLLVLPVVAKLGGGVSWLSGGYVVLLAVLMIVASGLQRRSWGLGLSLTLQVAMILGFFVHPALGAMGLIFAAVWGYILYLRRDMQQRIAAGRLPSQQE
ncbi:MAG: DUF4233 domain-containing protein [Mycobacteriaceae bacterium]